MTKNNKKITNIEDLAVMINNSFQMAQEHTDGRFDKVEGRLDGVEGRLDKVEGRLDKVEGRLMNIEIRMDNLESDVSEVRKHQIAHTIYRDEFEKLLKRVETLEKSFIKKAA